MIAIAAVGSLVMYGLLYVIPVKPFIWVFERWAQLVIVGEVFQLHILNYLTVTTLVS